MNFKKFISGVSALTIAASAFAGMAVTASAATTTLMEYGTTDVAWTAENLATWTAGGSPTLADGVVTISGGNGSYATSKTINPTENSIINVSAVWRGASGLGRNFDKGNGSYFRFGNIIVAQNDQTQSHGYGFTGLSNISSVTKFSAGSYRVAIDSSTWLKIDMEINTATNTLTSFTIKSEDEATTYVTQSNVALASPDYTTVAFGYQKGGSVGSTNTEQLKSIKITQTTQEVQKYDYTVNYTLNGTPVRTVSGSLAAGAVVNTDSKFTVDDQRYYITAATAPSLTVTDNAEDNVLNVPVRVADNYSYTVNSSVGSYSVSGEVVEGDSATVPYPEYIIVDGTAYKKTAINNQYNYTFTPSSNEQVETLDYAEDKKNVVYFEEGEDAFTEASVSNAGVRCSMGKGGDVSDSEATTVTTLPAGRYVITAAVWGGGQETKNNSTYSFKVGDSEVYTISTTGSRVETSSAVFTVSNDTALTVIKSVAGDRGACLDLVMVQKIGIDGLVEPVGNYTTADGYDANTKAWTVTFEPGEYTFNKVVVTPSEGDAQEYESPNVYSSGDVVFGIIASGDYYNCTFTAVASYVE